MNITTNEIAKLYFEEQEAILHIEILQNADMTVENLQKHYRTVKKITKGKKYFALINAHNFYTIDLEGIRYSASPEAIENRIAAAYYAAPLANRLNINFLKIAHEPGIPLDIFDTEDDALRWTRDLKRKLEDKQ